MKNFRAERKLQQATLYYLVHNLTKLEDIKELRDVFVKFDENHDGRISLEEFSDNYIDIIKKLRYRQIECEDKMLEHYE